MLSPETPILLLTTGGTIDKVYFDALSDYQVGETVMAKLLEVARVKRPFRIEEVTRKDSLELDETDRALIVARVAAAREKHIVITHGTDTMTDTAKELAGIEGKTIVLVGALAPRASVRATPASTSAWPSPRRRWRYRASTSP